MTGFTSVTQMIATPGATWAHRGGSSNWPEMSQLAYQNAAAAGYGALEFSCARTSDGVWFGLHDEDINRVAGTTGLPPASQMTWAEVQAYTNTTAGGAEPFWKLTDFLDTYSGSHVCIVDHKYAWGFLGEWFTLLDSYAAHDRIVVKYFGVGGGSTDLADQAAAAGYATWGYFYEADVADGDLAISEPHWDLLGMEWSASQAAWDAVLAYGKPVVGHIADSQAEYDTAVSLGAAMVQCSNVLGIAAVGAPPPTEPPAGVNHADIYDFAGWIEMAPDFDWDNLVPPSR